VIAPLTYTRRPLGVRLASRLMRWWLRREIASAEEYARMARAGGILSEPELELLAVNITPLRVRLAMWECV